MLEARSREYVEQRIRAGVLEQGTVDLLDASGVGERMRREGLVHHGIELQFDGERHRIPLSELAGGRTIVVYGQTEVVKDLIAARLASGAPLLFEVVRRRRVHELDSEQPRHPLRARRPHGGARVRLHRRLRRLPRRLPRDHPRAALRTYAREYPFGWLGILAAVAPSSDELDLRAPRARLRAAQPALAGAEPALRAVPARRGHRRVAGRAHLGGAAAPARPRRLDAGRGPGAREGRDGHAQLRRRADALRAPLPRRRRRAHRPADRRERAQPRDRGRAHPGRGARELACDGQPRAARRLLGDLPAARLARRALLLVDDLDAAPLARRRPLRAEAAALAAAQRRLVARGRRRCWPRTTSASCVSSRVRRDLRAADAARRARGPRLAAGDARQRARAGPCRGRSRRDPGRGCRGDRRRLSRRPLRQRPSSRSRDGARAIRPSRSCARCAPPSAARRRATSTTARPARTSWTPPRCSSAVVRSSSCWPTSHG